MEARRRDNAFGSTVAEGDERVDGERGAGGRRGSQEDDESGHAGGDGEGDGIRRRYFVERSEEHTSELQSQR